MFFSKGCFDGFSSGLAAITLDALGVEQNELPIGGTEPGTSADCIDGLEPDDDAAASVCC